MKYFLTILMFLSCPFLYAQDKDTITVMLSPVSFKPGSGIFTMADSVQFFKLPENKLVLMPDIRHWRQLPMALTLPRAAYRITFKNIFGQTVTKECHLYNDSTRIDLCCDSLISYPENTLAKLQDKDSLVVNFQSQGCFNSNTEKLVITRRGTAIEAKYYSDEWRSKGKKKGQIHKLNILRGKKILTSANLLEFVRFENELRQIEGAGCTTTDYYFVKSKYFTITKTDGGCHWSGFYFLTAALFPHVRDRSEVPRTAESPTADARSAGTPKKKPARACGPAVQICRKV